MRDMATPVKVALTWFIASIWAVGFMMTGAAQGAETFVFDNGSAFDNVVADGSLSMTSGSIILTSVDAGAPDYTCDSSVCNWDGSSFVNNQMTHINTALGIDNLSIPTGTTLNSSESQHMNAGESWTASFNVDVIFRVLDMVSVGDSDFFSVTIDTSPTPTVFDFATDDLDASDDRADPFGASFKIPANTNITITNTTAIPTSKTTDSGFSEVIRVGSFTVEEFVPVPGDYNGNLVVDAADYTVWRDNLGGPAESLLNRDTENSGDINSSDYDFWKEHFGDGGGGGAVLLQAVPEPTTIVLVGCVVAGLCLARRGMK